MVRQSLRKSDLDDREVPMDDGDTSTPPALTLHFIQLGVSPVQLQCCVSWTVIDAAQVLRDWDLSRPVSPSTHC